jgi:hypothetical protein
MIAWWPSGNSGKDWRGDPPMPWWRIGQFEADSDDLRTFPVWFGITQWLNELNDLVWQLFPVDPMTQCCRSGNTDCQEMENS